MKRFGLAFNPTRPATIELAERAAKWCLQNDAETWAAESGETEALVARLANTDCLIVLGGDGTFLRAARALARVDVPVLGVNSGHVGFLSKIDPQALESTLEELLRDEYKIEARMMLEASLIRGAHDGVTDPGGTFAALNDAAIVRGAEARVLRMEVLIDDSHLTTYVADGVVIATPTGS